MIIDKVKESVHKFYGCNGKYRCEHYNECEMCAGENTPYDCCECGASDYYEGYLACSKDLHQRTKEMKEVVDAFEAFCHSIINNKYISNTLAAEEQLGYIKDYREMLNKD